MLPVPTNATRIGVVEELFTVRCACKTWTEVGSGICCRGAQTSVVRVQHRAAEACALRASSTFAANGHVPRVRRSSPLVLLLLFVPACDDPSLAQTCDPTANTLPIRAEARPWSHAPAGLVTVSDGIPLASSDSGWKCEGEGVSLASNQLLFTYPPGFQSGYAPGVAYLDLPAPTPETYFGFLWKPSDPWQTHPSGVNKIALLFPATSSGGTIYIMLFWDGRRYTVQVETTFDSDTRRLEPNLTATPVKLGEWHQIEWYVRYSSNPSSRDGVVRWWLDGVAQGEYTDLQMPPDAGFIQYTIRPVWGGGVGDSKKQRDSFAYGRVYISKR